MQDELDLLLRDVPAARPAGRAPRPRPARPPSAPRDELDELLEGVPAATPRDLTFKARPMQPRAGATASPSPTAPARPGPPASWVFDTDAPKLKEYFRSKFNRDLPLSVEGQSSYHKGKGLDHSRSLDIAVHPDSDEGRAVIEYFEQNNHPFRAFRSARGLITGAHVHAGFDSHSLGASDELDALIGALPEAGSPLSDLHDAPGGEGRVRETADPATPGMLRRKVGGETVLMAPGDALTSPASTAPVEVDEIVESSRGPGAAPLGPPQLPARRALDPQVQADRAERDAREAAESRPDARKIVDVRLPEGVKDWSDATGKQAARQTVAQFAEEKGIPAGFPLSEWMRAHDSDLRLYNLATGEDLAPADLLGTSSYDPAARTIRVSAELPFLKKLEADYDEWKSHGRAALDWLTDDERSAGEKLLDVAGPVAAAGGRGLRALGGIDDVMWASMRGGGPMNPGATAKAIEAGGAALRGDPVPEFAENSIAARIRSTGRPEDQFLGAVVEAITSPSNLIPAGLVGAFLKRAGRVGGLGRIGRAAELFTDGGKILKVEAAAGGAAADAAGRGAGKAAAGGVDDAVEFVVTMRDADGKLHRVNTATGEIEEDIAGEALDDDTMRAVQAAMERGNSLDAETFYRSRLELPEGYRLEGDRYVRAASPHAPGGVAPEARTVEGVFDDQSDLAGQFHDEVARRGYTSEADLDRAGKVFVQSARGSTDEQLRAMSAALEREFPPRPAGTPDELDELLEGVPAAEPATAAGRVKDLLIRVDDAGYKLAGVASDIINYPKAILTGFDFSATTRQGGPLLATRRGYLPEMLKEQAKAFKSESHFQDLVSTIREHPSYRQMREAGLRFDSLTDSKTPRHLRDDSFASKWADKTPGLRASERGYLAAKDILRLQAYEMLAPEVTRLAKPLEAAKARKALAAYINNMTGWGIHSQRGQRIAAFLRQPLFSPQQTVARMKSLNYFLNPVTYARLPQGARKVIARESFRTLQTYGVILGLAGLAGAEVQLNPFKGGFGKFKFGQTEYDVTGGRAFALQAVAQLAASISRSARGMKQKEGEDPAALALHFGRTQLGPLASAAVDYREGETLDRKPFTFPGAAWRMVAPFVLQDVVEGYQQAGAAGAAKALPSFVGVGVNTYEKTRRQKNEEGAAIVVPGRGGAELARHGIDVNFNPVGDERPDKDEGQFARPARTVAGVVDGSLSFSDPEDEWGNLAQTREHLNTMRREYEREVAAAVEREMDKPGYALFNSDADRKQYLGNVVQTVKNQVRWKFARETRGREIGELERLKGLHKELEGRHSPPEWMKPPSTPAWAPAPAPTPAPTPRDELDELLEGVPAAAPRDELDELLEDVPASSTSDGEGWEKFPPESGTLNVPRAAMPQIKSEHRGALVQFLKGRGIAHRQETVAAGSLKPSQAEYSRAKVERARGFEGPQRSILVSSDDYVADGHHQWLSDLTDAPGVQIPIIRLDAPIQQLLIEVARFPSAGVDKVSDGGG